MTETPLSIVKMAFDDWMNGTGAVNRIFAPEMRWEIVGRSVVSGHYSSADEFTAKVLVPMELRFSPSGPMRPIKIRGIYSDGPTVIVLWDGAGTTIVGSTYENTYAWIFTLDQGLVVNATALYDSIPFNELWDIAPRSE